MRDGIVPLAPAQLERGRALVQIRGGVSQGLEAGTIQSHKAGADQPPRPPPRPPNFQTPGSASCPGSSRQAPGRTTAHARSPRALGRSQSGRTNVFGRRGPLSLACTRTRTALPFRRNVVCVSTDQFRTGGSTRPLPTISTMPPLTSHTSFRWRGSLPGASGGFASPRTT